MTFQTIYLTADKVTPTTIDQIFALRYTDNPSNVAYWPRESIHSKIDEIIEKKSILFLTGRELSGKTRTIFEYAKNSSDLHICFLHQELENLSTIDLKKLPKKLLFVVDNIDMAIKKAEIAGTREQFNDLLISLVENKQPLLITSRDGLTLKELFNSEFLTDKLQQLLADNRISIPVLTAQDTKEFCEYWEKKTSQKFESTNFVTSVGSGFLAVQDLKQNFAAIKNLLTKKHKKSKFKHTNEAFIKCLLRSLVLLSYSNKYRFGNVDEETLKALTNKLYKEVRSDKTDKVSYNPFENFFSEQAKEIKEENQKLLWQESIEFISSSFGNWVVNKTKKEIQFDPYLLHECFAKQPAEKSNFYPFPFSSISGFFSADKQQKYNFWQPPLSLISYLYEIKSIALSEAEKLLSQLKTLNVDETTAVLNAVLQKIDTFKNSQKFYASYCIENDTPNKQSILLKKARNIEEFQSVLENYKSKGLTPTYQDLLFLVPKFSNWNDQKQLLSAIQESGSDYKRDLSKLIRQLNVSENPADVLQFLADLKGNLLKEDYIVLANKIERWRDIKEILSFSGPGKKITLNDLNFNPYRIKKLLRNAPLWEEANEVYQFAIKSDIELSAEDYQQLLRNAPTSKVAKDILAAAKENKVSVGREFYNQLVNKAETAGEAIEAYRIIMDKGIGANLVTFQGLLRKTRDHQTSIYFQKMMDQGIIPNYGIFRVMIIRSRKYSQALRWLYEMISWNIVPSEDILEVVEKLAKASKEELPTEFDKIKNLQQLAKNNLFTPKNNNASIFISYSHKNKDITAEFTTYFEANGFNIFFDIKNPKYKETLQKYWHRIKGSKWVICMIDENYLQSPYCIIELHRLLFNPKYKHVVKAFDVSENGLALDSAAIESSKAYWKDKKQETIDRLKASEHHPNIFRELDLIKRFERHIGDIFLKLQRVPLERYDKNHADLAEKLRRTPQAGARRDWKNKKTTTNKKDVKESA